MKPTWKKYLLYGSGVGIGGILAYVLIETIRAKNTGFETKTLWDWMELLVIPLVLAGGAFYLQRSERAVERKIAEDRAALERNAAEDRAKLEREITTDRQQEAALQAYLDRMAELLLKEKLLEDESEKALNVARVRTLTVIRTLNATRNRTLLRFLSDMGLAGKKESNLFADADLESVDLQGVDLSYTNLQHANLADANLQGARLTDSNLRAARLGGTDLQGARLGRTNLQGAVLMGANLQHAFLVDADLQYANLGDANLQGAILMGANLQHAILEGANLADSNLESTLVLDSQLATAKTLKGVTMPDGTKHD